MSKGNSTMADERSVTGMWSHMVVKLVGVRKKAMASVFELALEDTHTACIHLFLLELVYNEVLIIWDLIWVFSFFLVKFGTRNHNRFPLLLDRWMNLLKSIVKFFGHQFTKSFSERCLVIYIRTKKLFDLWWACLFI